MNLRRFVTVKSVFIALVFFTCLFAFKEEKDSLHKRTFTVNLTEVKDGVVAKKSIADEFYFKDGKVFSNYLFEKFGYKAIRYRINKDSIYTDSTNTEVRQLDVEASATNEDNLTVAMTFTTVEWDIDGVIKVTKNDKIKKYLDFAGREKGGKPKKEKKKKEEDPSANAEANKKEE